MLQPIESEVEPLLLLAMSMSHNAQLKYLKVSSSEQIDLECFRNGKNITKTSSLKNAKKLSSDFVKVEYNQFNNKPTLNVTYD